MFVLSKEQFHTLVDEKQEKYENWLDLGAGDGGALERLGVKVRDYRYFLYFKMFSRTWPRRFGQRRFVE